MSPCPPSRIRGVLLLCLRARAGTAGWLLESRWDYLLWFDVVHLVFGSVMKRSRFSGGIEARCLDLAVCVGCTLARPVVDGLCGIACAGPVGPPLPQAIGVIA